METRPIFVLIGLLAAAGAMAQAYRWVDENGVVHYSDVPREGAEEIQLSEYTRDTGARLYTAPRRPVGNGDAAEEEPPFSYDSIAVSSPGAEETLWNIDGVLNVSLAISPGLQAGHRVRVYFDGQPRFVSGTSFQIEEVWRGVHNIQAEVIDETGKLMIRTQPNRFYVQQNSVIGAGRR